MTESKKAWVEPELIVLVRSNPEEAVLAACKDFPGAGAGSSDSGCAVLSCASMCLGAVGT